MFDSCRGLRYFLCPTLVSCWMIHLSHFIAELTFFKQVKEYLWGKNTGHCVPPPPRSVNTLTYKVKHAWVHKSNTAVYTLSFFQQRKHLSDKSTANCSVTKVMCESLVHAAQRERERESGVGWFCDDDKIIYRYNSSEDIKLSG